MIRKNRYLPLMAEFFESQGKILTSAEYAKVLKKPMTGQGIKRHFGSYARMTKALEAYYKTVEPKVTLSKVEELKAKLAKPSGEVKEDLNDT